MKNNLSANKQFQKNIMILLEQHYRNTISENVKRALRNKKKLSTSSNLICKAV